MKKFIFIFALTLSGTLFSADESKVGRAADERKRIVELVNKVDIEGFCKKDTSNFMYRPTARFTNVQFRGKGLECDRCDKDGRVVNSGDKKIVNQCILISCTMNNPRSTKFYLQKGRSGYFISDRYYG